MIAQGNGAAPATGRPFRIGLKKMKTYPVRVPRQSYKGADRTKQQKNYEYNMLCQHVEEYLNAKLAERPDDSITQFLSYSVASEMGADADLVRRIIYSIDAGSNGVTICKGDFERAMARVSSAPASKS